MFIINTVSYLLQLDIFKYLIMSFSFYGVFLLIRKVVFNR